MTFPAQPSPTKSSHKQASYKLQSSTKQLRFPNSLYIHPSRYHTRSTDLAQLFIQEYDHHITPIYHPVTGVKETYDSLSAQYPVQWETSFSNDIDRLSQGVGTRMKSGNKNILCIPRSKVPSERKTTYANPVCDYFPRKDDPYCIRLTISGDKLPHPLDSGSSAATLLGENNMSNSYISTPGSQFIWKISKTIFSDHPWNFLNTSK